jgi:hypothetical protein
MFTTSVDQEGPASMRFELSGAQSAIFVPGIPFSLNFTISARIRGEFTFEMLQGALERLRLRHPLIAVRIAPAGHDSPACFTTDGVPPIPVRIVERQSGHDWVGEVEREIARPTDYAKGPLFRCVWVRGAGVSDLILVCDHLAGDGMAGVYALRDLLELLADPGLILEPLPAPRLADLVPPAMRARIEEVISASDTAVIERPEEMPGAIPAGQLRVLPLDFDEAATGALVSRCRAEGVTVQAALLAAFALPFAERHPEAPVRRFESPANLRGRLLRPVGEVYGNYISLIYTDVDCSPGRDAWEIARQAHRDLAAVTDEQLFTVPIVMMAVSNRPLPIPVVDVAYDVSISNLGRVDIPGQYGQLVVESIYAPTMNISTPAHRILDVVTFGGQMRCTFVSCDPQAPQVLQRAREVLAGMVAK